MMFFVCNSEINVSIKIHEVQKKQGAPGLGTEFVVKGILFAYEIKV